ncbi:hypothetical protein EIP91_001218 [Steccherinum ochraceum]|uniref:Cell wall mannoprotein n=1 Tax=Steccherinum ochraceum TaxID=92696 RepID=A0A4R0RXT2_9APHY|nr:hypothetical protein EIP91_001218 [Steccherinum ochraceum]
MMLSKSFSIVVSLLVVSTIAAPIKREVPQEHSHEKIITSVRASLNVNNPDKIQDPIFALLGDAAAAAGAGDITDLSCLQQAVADQAFTNAKAAGDIAGMTNALIFRALERNTGQVGLASASCNETAKNPEIQALTQHQDPASNNAASVNKNITLELAKQINSVGGNALDAIQSGTFAPGDPNDNTGKGNSCDDANDAQGCIFTQNLLVADASEDEINAAIGASNQTVSNVNKNSGNMNNSSNSTSSGTSNNNGSGSSISATEVDAVEESSTEIISSNGVTISESSVVVQLSIINSNGNQITETAASTVLIGFGGNAPTALTPVISAADNNGTAVWKAQLPATSSQ